MEGYEVKILKIEDVTPTVKAFTVEKPEEFKHTSGHHTGITIEDTRRPFSIASPENKNYLQFIIRRYEEGRGFTKKIHSLKVGDKIKIMDKSRGGIEYEGEGIFIAAGTGITPFLSIFRTLKEKGKLNGNELFYMNRTKEEIIFEEELKDIFGKDAVFFLTREKVDGYVHGRINEEFLKTLNFKDKKVYLCGPTLFVREMKGILNKIGVEEGSIISETR